MPTINRFWSTERVEKPAIIFCKQSEVSTVHCMLRKAMRSHACGNEVPINSSPSMPMSITCVVLEVSRLANLSQIFCSFIQPYWNSKTSRFPFLNNKNPRVSKTLLTPKTPWPNTSSRNICQTWNLCLHALGWHLDLEDRTKTFGNAVLQVTLLRGNWPLKASSNLKLWCFKQWALEHFFEGRMLDYPK